MKQKQDDSQHAFNCCLLLALFVVVVIGLVTARFW